MNRKRIARDQQKTAKVLDARALGRMGDGRWIVREKPGAELIWDAGTAVLELIRESKGYVRLDTVRTIPKVVYEQAPVHHVEIWNNPANGETHVRIFGLIS